MTLRMWSSAVCWWQLQGWPTVSRAWPSSSPVLWHDSSELMISLLKFAFAVDVCKEGVGVIPAGTATACGMRFIR